MRTVFFSVAVLCLFSTASALELVWGGKIGSFTLSFANGLSISSTAPAVRSHGMWCRPPVVNSDIGEHPCVFKATGEPSAFTLGNDILGTFNRSTVTFNTSFGEDVTYGVRLYESAVVFETYFRDGLVNATTSQTNVSVTQYPNFQLGHGALADTNNIGTLHYKDVATRGVVSTLADLEHIGYSGWDCPKMQSCSFQGTFLSLMRRDSAFCMVLSALTGFDSNVISIVQRHLSYGILGTITEVPAGHYTETVLWIEEGPHSGTNAAVSNWGSFLRAKYKRKRTAFNASLAVSHLGYSTTAYYFYTTMKDKNFEETILEVYKEAQRLEIPFRTFLLDSWYVSSCGPG